MNKSQAIHCMSVHGKLTKDQKKVRALNALKILIECKELGDDNLSDLYSQIVGEVQPPVKDRTLKLEKYLENCASTDKTRKILHGLHYDKENRTLAATDGKVLGWKEDVLQDRQTGTIDFKTGNVLSGAYPNYRQLLPELHKYSESHNIRHLMQNNTDILKSSIEMIAINLPDSDKSIIFRRVDLKKALSMGGRVMVQFCGNTNPAYFENNMSYKAIVMPVRMSEN